jgi:thioredoxin:protein disulfide reductase
MNAHFPHARPSPSSLSHLRRRGRSTTLAAVCAALAVLLVPALALAQEPDAFTRALEKGPFFAGLAAFVGGLLTAATPCVYPMIAITVSIFGAREATSRRQAMLLSTSFVLGIVVLFTPMVVGAALTGKLFGTLLSNRWVVLALVTVFVALASSMFGAFEMVLPDALMQRLSSVGGVGYGGAFVLGLVSGIVAAPCTGPVLTGVLIWIGKTQNVLLGSIVGATFALGLGLPFWLVGTFAVSLPKGGKWMLGVKSFFGIVILVYAIHLLSVFPFVRSLARPDVVFMGVAAAVGVVGLLLGAVHLDWGDGLGAKIRKGAGVALAVAGPALAWTAWELPKEAPPADPNALALVWEHSEKDASARAKSEGRPLLVDFTADWCAACKEIAKETFSDPRVMEKAVAAKYVAVKVDATNDEDPQVDAVKGKYRVVGLPTVVIFDSTGQERKRFNEFVGPELFLSAMEGIR